MFIETTSQPPARLGEAEEVIDRAISDERLVGVVVLVARDGQIILRKAAGYADRESRRRMDVDAIFRFASLTKPIVTAAALSLIERKEVELGDPVTRWIPRFRPKLSDGAEPVITIRHLLTHTAGLTYGLFQAPSGSYATAGVSDGLDAPGLTMDEQLQRLAEAPLCYEPGSEWGYSLAIDVLGAVLSKAVGAPLQEIVEDRVTGPLGMSDTAFAVADESRLSAQYVDGTPPRRMNDPELVPFGDGAGITFSPSRIFNRDSYPSGGAGMAGTAEDFLRFLEAIRQEGSPILSSKTAKAMMNNQIGKLRINVEPTPSWGFGFGGAVLMDPQLAETPQAIGTWRWGGVYGHHWFVDPVNRLTLVSLSNTTVEGFAGAYKADLLRAIYRTPGTEVPPQRDLSESRVG